MSPTWISKPQLNVQRQPNSNKNPSTKHISNNTMSSPLILRKLLWNTTKISIWTSKKASAITKKHHPKTTSSHIKNSRISWRKIKTFHMLSSSFLSSLTTVLNTTTKTTTKTTARRCSTLIIYKSSREFTLMCLQWCQVKKTPRHHNLRCNYNSSRQRFKALSRIMKCKWLQQRNSHHPSTLIHSMALSTNFRSCKRT